ncbi:MAG: hypothetical protein V9H26_12955 [Verrucomicrobiota bacterium]
MDKAAEYYPSTKDVTTVTLTGTDGTNSATSVTFTVTVNDNQSPTLVAPLNQNLNVIANTCAANYTIADPFSDNCTGGNWGYSTTGATILSSSGNSISDGTSSSVLSFNKGVTIVTLTGTDGTNAATTATFMVTVNPTPVEYNIYGYYHLQWLFNYLNGFQRKYLYLESRGINRSIGNSFSNSDYNLYRNGNNYCWRLHYYSNNNYNS